ncbi:MAG: DUF3854 domain-containing protein [Nitrospirales bacterium]|nr:DUF3854 domain-containing protein [Nitrospirales bacterium]
MKRPEPVTSNTEKTQGHRKMEEPESGSSDTSSSNDSGKPETLAQHHWNMLTSESGIQREVIECRGYCTVAKKSHVKKLGFKDTQCNVPALLIPIYNAQGNIALYQSRPDSPRIKESKPIKYETMAGSVMALDCHPSIRHQLQNPNIPLWITEGIKKGDSLVSHGCCAIALLGVWNWRGTNENGGKTVLPDWESIALNGRLVYLAFDSDVMVKQGVYQALARLSGFLTLRGARVQYIYLPEGETGAKLGVDDYLVQGHTVADLLALATEQLQKPLPTEEQPKKGRPTIQVNGRFLREIVDDALDALQIGNDPPVIFRRGSTLVRLQTKPALAAEILTIVTLKGRLDRVADCMVVTEKGDKPARPPSDVVADILAHHSPPFPVLNGISLVPLFVPGGRLLTSEGYDPEYGLFLNLRGLEDVRGTMPIDQAQSLILDELLGDFPFVDDASRAHILALLLLPFMRQMIQGPTPLHLIHAPTRGTGKGLLADIVALVTLGIPAPVMALTGQEVETEKRITALLLSGTSLILLDNVTVIRSASLAAVLTASEWQGRRLGQSEMVRAPNNATWLATGNNVELSDELARRVVTIRLDSKMGKPEQRRGFRHPNLVEWVQDHRSKLVSACLSLIQTWIDAGKPPGVATLGRFEQWTQVLGGILQVCGIPGFLSDRQWVHTEADQDTRAWEDFCAAWYEQYGTLAVTAKDLFEVAKERSLLLTLWGGRSTLAAQQRLGHALADRRDRLFGQLYIRSADRASTGNKAYCLETHQESPDKTRRTPQTPKPHPSRAAQSANGTRISSVSSVSGQGKLQWDNAEEVNLAD